MAKNRMINTKFWSDTYISSIDPLEKLLFLYFITNQYTNICGIYEIPLKQVSLDTGIDRDNLEKVFLPRLAQAGKIYYIDGWVYIKNFLKHQKASGNVALGINNGLNDVPAEIMAKIKTISDTPPSHPSHSLKPKLELELEPKPKKKSDKMSEIDFASFWSVYPRHQSKSLAHKKFLSLSKSLLPTILEAVEKQRKSEQWQKDNGKFIPYPTTWLNQQRWEDEQTISSENEMESYARWCLQKWSGDHDQAMFEFTDRTKSKYTINDLPKVKHIIKYGF